MCPALRSRLAVLAFVSLVLPGARSAEAIDNVLLRWREQVARCGQRPFGES